MDKVRVGVIGCGGMGSSHLGYLNTVEGAVLAAVCDIDAEKAKQRTARSTTCPAFLNHQDLLASKHLRHGHDRHAAL